MALPPKPIIHCVIDLEPAAFHTGGATAGTVPFAINLSFEVGADSAADEAVASEMFLNFLTSVQEVKFHLYRLKNDDATNLQLEPFGTLTQVSEPTPLGKPSQLHDWLADQKPDPAPAGARYWTTDASWSPDRAVDVDAATATHRLRATQAWNAPVAHRFGLTHVVRIPVNIAKEIRVVVLPYLVQGATPQPIVNGKAIDGSTSISSDSVFDFTYDALGKVGPVVCRTTVVFWTEVDLNPSDIDPSLSPDGFLNVDPNAEKVRRLLKWFEERAASLMAANPALTSRATSVTDTAFEQSFGLHVEQVTEGEGENKKIVDVFHWGSLVWFVVARLTSALDNLVIGLLKPVPAPADGKLAFDHASEGEILAPLVSLLLDRLTAIAESAKLHPDALDAHKVTAAIRTVIAGSPLIAPKDNADLVRALRLVYGIDPLNAATKPPPVGDARELIAEVLARYAGTSGTRLPERAFEYAETIKGQSVMMVSRALLDLEQLVQEETGVEAAILKLIESAQAPGGASVENRIAEEYLKKIKHPNPQEAQAAVAALVDEALVAYRKLLESPFNGAEAVRRAAGTAFVRNLLDFAKIPRPEKDSSVVLVDVANQSAFHARRFLTQETTAPQACFDPLIAALVIPDHGMLDLKPPPAVPPEKKPEELIRKHLDEAFADAIAPMKSVNDPDARFIPDSMPQPLAVQIAANIDGSAIDKFTRHFNGIAVAIRRLDSADATDRWAHAHLADLNWGPEPDEIDLEKPETPDVKAALHPMLPAVSDGRGAMFIEYEGFPFADPAFDARIVEQDGAVRDERAPFYRHTPHQPVYPPGGGTTPIFSQVPRLAYGRRFETFSFITTNAGTLPLTLQRKPPALPGMPAASLWMPDPDIIAPVATPPLVGEAAYQRRTAIAQMAVVEQVKGARPRRIGAPIEDVTPLAEDYARIAFQAAADAPAAHDIFRDTNGAGKMGVGEFDPEGEKPPARAEWRISDIRFTGAPTELTLRFFGRHAANPAATGIEFPIGQAMLTDLTEIEIHIVYVAPQAPDPVPAPPPSLKYERWIHVICGKGATPLKAPLPGHGSLAGWLRLELKSGAGAAAMTFSDPSGQKTDNVPAPLVLLAPRLAPGEKSIWNQGLSDAVEATVSTPRVGYLDFERWFANRDLYKKTFKTEPESVDSPAAKFMHALLTAYLMRHFDSRLATLMDRLPDPAVEAVRLELTALDRLTDHEPGIPDAATYNIADRLREFASTLKEPAAVTLKTADGTVKETAAGWTPLRLREMLLEPLDRLFQFHIKLLPATGLSLVEKADSTDPKLRRFEASVPAGVVARLSLDALVPSAHFTDQGDHPSAFDQRLLQYGPRELGRGYFAFPAAAIRVETMYDDVRIFASPITKDGQQVKKFNELAIDLARRMIAAEGIERTRSFALRTAAAVPQAEHETVAQREELTRRWRVLGEIGVTTQQFKSGGRPIYHYVNPRAHRSQTGKTVNPPEELATEPVKHPALPLELDGELAQFELEAFFDRPDIDADPARPQKLAPLPARTKLQERHWNSEAASYFRHRFMLRSRYAGALIPRDKREINAWPTRDLKTTAHGWTMRVAMLAELSRIKMTRPQLRALIPLTTAPGGEDPHAPAPPIAAILQEPPFAGGGLADRIASEIKTGFGYGFQDGAAETHVEIRDSRKEAGPNPHLDYRPLHADSALGLVLRSEGPIGLTFDAVNAPAPALPNSMLLLKPGSLFGETPGFEEFFAGVAMRRYIDPDWTTNSYIQGEEPEKQGVFDGERYWWINPVTMPRTEGQEKEALLQFKVDGESQPRTLLAYTSKAAGVVIFASKRAIDGVGGMTEDVVPIARIAESEFIGLSILHQPVAPGRYATAVFVRAKSAKTERGEANVPLIVAGFEWSPNKPGAGNDQPPLVKLVTGAGATACETMASAPTFLKWTKTSRDFDFVNIAQVDEDWNWKPRPTHAREIVADLDHTTHEFLTFRRNGASDPAWLLPSTFANPYPLHVHRHLGLITSRFLKELGSPAEIFCRTSADPELKHELVTPQGALRDSEGNIFKPQEQIVRVVEFESPAAILCATKTPAVLETYKQAYFDLVSTGFKLGRVKDPKTGNEKPPEGSLRLYFRFVGPPQHLWGFSKITLHLRPATELVDGKPSSGPFVLEIELKNIEPNKPKHTAPNFAVGIELVLQRDSDGKTKYRARLLRSNGLFGPATLGVVPDKKFELVDAGKDNPGFFVSIAEATGAGEFWTDISLLHSPQALPTHPLDFGWLFSASGEGEPAAHVTPAGLSSMVEAQARIVMVSPPIPIVTH